MDEERTNLAQAEAAKAMEVLGVTNETPNTAPAQAEPQTEPAPAESTSQAPPQPGEVITPAEPAKIVEGSEAEVQPEEDYESIDIPTFEMAQRQAQAQQPQQQAQPTQLPALDPKDFTSEDGEVDMAKFSQAFQARDQLLTQQIVQQVVQNVIPQVSQMTSRQVTAAKQEERLWEATFKKYPQIKDNKELRDLVHKTRLGSYRAQDDSVLTPLRAADSLFKYIGAAKAEGAKSATESVRVQASAHLESADNTASERGLKTQNDYANIDNRDKRVSEAARIDLLKSWLQEGKL